MRHFVFRWFVTAFAVFVAAPIVGIDYTGIGCLLGASLLLGIINAFVRPILLFLSIPLILVTLGFFILIINALMLKFVSEIAKPRASGRIERRTNPSSHGEMNP